MKMVKAIRQQAAIAERVAVNTADTEGASPFRPVVDRLRARGSFATVYESNGVVVMRRIHKNGAAGEGTS